MKIHCFKVIRSQLAISRDMPFVKVRDTDKNVLIKVVKYSQ